MDTQYQNFTLGLDIGASSIGWSVVEYASSIAPGRIVAIGSRIFEAGVEGNLETGKETSKALPRREARLARRGTDRRSRRLSKIYKLLADHDMMPALELGGTRESPTDTRSGEKRTRRKVRTQSRDKAIAELDRKLFEAWSIKLSSEGWDKSKIHSLAIKFPYFLRARGLDEKLTPTELGRCIYQLSQRRGFLSNRKSPQKRGEDLGEVKKEISELRRFMADCGARTLGEYFSTQDPTVKRFRKRWTARDMYVAEFDQLWEKQKVFHPNLLTDDLKADIYKAMFFQRPLKSQKGRIGKCEHEKNKARAPIAILDAQRFRLLQSLLNLRVTWLGQPERELTPEERSKLTEILEYQDKMTFPQVKKILSFPKSANFSIESGGEKNLPGNRTSAKLLEVFGELWKTFPDEKKNQIVEDILSIQKRETLVKRGRKAWGLDDEKAEIFGDVSLEEGYARISRRALKKLLPLMVAGKHYATAVKEIYGDKQLEKSLDILPPMKDIVGDIRNPAVQRSLTELRKLVNAVVRKYGKPASVHIELARELKKSRSDREEISRRNRDNEKLNKRALEEIKVQTCIQAPSSTDILKFRLAEECDWLCPYTGRQISMENLFVDPQFDIEHIVPFSRCMDNSFLNKTLCHHEENRNVKQNRTPFEAYSGNPDKYDEILKRVAKFKGDARDIKLRRFQMQEIEGLDDFTTRQLNDTRYTSRLAGEYLSVLYGPEARSRIQVSTGQITAFVRDELELNNILSDGGVKTRNDHRHHAVDAVAIALIDRSLVKRMADASKRAKSEKRRLFGRIDPPWVGFHDEVRERVGSIVVSHKVPRGINGPLHEETNYKPGPLDKNGKQTWRLRVALDKLKATDVEKIADPHVRSLVREKIESLGGGEPSKLFTEPENLPFLVDSDGEIHNRIRAVTILRSDSPFTIGSDDSARHVLHKSNHHIEIIETTDKKGKVKWEGVMVTNYQAMLRKRYKKPIVQKNHGEGRKFICSIYGGEIFEIDNADGQRELFIVRTISQDARGKISVWFVRISDARLKKEMLNSGDFTGRGIEPLRKLNFKKKVITPLGEVRDAVD